MNLNNKCLFITILIFTIVYVKLDYALYEPTSEDQRLLLRCKNRCYSNNSSLKKFCKTCLSLGILDNKNEEENSTRNLNFNIRTPLRVALCAIVKNENPYIREWINYYKDMGIDKILLYDNNDIDGERLEDVIKDYIENKFVNVFNRRGIIIQNRAYGKSTQGLAYHSCYYNNYKNYDWIAFFDIDEFLSIDYKYNDIFEFLSDFNDYDGIKVQWRMFGDNGQLYYENKPVIERFLSNNNFKHDRTVKSIIKCRDYDFKLLFGAHGFSNRAPAVVNVNKNRVYGYRDSKIYYNLPVYLNHFYSKSTEEFIKRKYKKSDATFGNKHNGNYQIDSLMKKYFQYNNVTKEKIDLFNNIKKELDGVE